MSDRNLRLQVVLSAVDKLTRPFKSAMAGNKQLAQSIRNSRDEIKRLNQAGENLTAFNKLNQSVKQTGDELDRTRLRAQMMTREMSAMDAPTKKQTQALEAQWRAVSKLEGKQRDEVNQIARVRAELYRMGISAKDGKQATARIQSQTESYNAKLAEQEKLLRRVGDRQRKMALARNRYDRSIDMRNKLAGTGVSLVAQGGTALLGVSKTVNEASKYDMEMAGFRSLGVGEGVLKDADKFARGMDIMGNSATDNLRTLKEAHAVLRDYHEAKIVTPELARLQYATKFMASHGVSDEAAQEMRDQSPSVLKIAELRNHINSPEDFKKSLNLSAQAMAASGGMVLPDDYMGMLKTGGIAAKQMDDKAFYFSMSHIIQQIGGDRTGTSLSSAYQNWMMGRTTAGAASELMDLGLLRKDAVEYGKTGHIKKIKPGALINQDKYLSDPFNYLLTEVIPRIQKRHPNLDERGMETAIAKLFSSRTGGDLFVTMYRERANIQKQISAGQSAYNVDQLVGEGNGTAQGQQIGMEAKKRDLYLQMGQDILPLYVSALSNVAAALSKVTHFFREHEVFAKSVAIGAVAFGVIATLLGGVAIAVTSVLGPLALLKFVMSKMGGEGAGMFSRFGGVVVGAVRGIIKVLGMLRVAVLSNPILAVIALIALGAYLIWKNWDTLGPKFKAIWEAVKQFTFDAWEWIKGAVSAAWDWLVNILINWSLPGLIYQHWDAIKSYTLNIWDGIKGYISSKWDEIVGDVKALPDKFKEAGSAIIDSLLQGINYKWEGVKAKLSSLTDYLPDWMKGGKSEVSVNGKGGKSAPMPANPLALGGAGMSYAGMYDAGGHIPSGKFGIVGERGREIVHGPANVIGRRQTATMAAVAALSMGVSSSAMAAPLHPLSLPASEYQSNAGQGSGRAVSGGNTGPTQNIFHITAAQGQSPQDIAMVVSRMLDERERKALARNNSRFSDRGDFPQ